MRVFDEARGIGNAWMMSSADLACPFILLNVSFCRMKLIMKTISSHHLLRSRHAGLVALCQEVGQLLWARSCRLVLLLYCPPDPLMT